MTKFSESLAAVKTHKSFVPRPADEAKEADLVIAEDAALSRLLPIRDVSDPWEVLRSRAVTGSGRTAPN
jgi:hypothetical protein